MSAVSIDNRAFSTSAKNLVVPPSSTIKLPVNFSPTKAAAYSGTLIVKSNGIGSPATAKVLGTGVKK